MSRPIFPVFISASQDPERVNAISVEIIKAIEGFYLARGEVDVDEAMEGLLLNLCVMLHGLPRDGRARLLAHAWSFLARNAAVDREDPAIGEAPVSLSAMGTKGTA